MLALVESAIRQNRMFSHGQRVGVAVSGGRDSVCLLDVLDQLRPSLGVELTVLHVNHGWRPEADADEEFVQQLAQRRGLPFLVDHPPPSTGNREQAARQDRLRFFGRAPVDRVATGHTASDQAETVLFRILRGSAVSGLTGVHAVWGKLVRPLRMVSRAAVDAWVEERGLEFREDATNADRQFARNRIRHELLPRLRESWNPQIDSALVHLAEVAAAEDELLESLVAPLPEPERDGSIVLSTLELEQMPLALRRRWVRRAIAAVKTGDVQIGYEHIEAFLQLKPGHDRVILPGVDVMRSFEWIRLRGMPEPVRERNWSCLMAVPGTVETAEAGLISIALQEVICAYNEVGSWVAVNPDRPLAFRNWRPGDKWEPAAEEAVSLKELFQRHRIPLWERRDWPILEQEGRVVWAGEFGAVPGGQPGAFVAYRPPALRYRRREKRSP